MPGVRPAQALLQGVHRMPRTALPAHLLVALAVQGATACVCVFVSACARVRVCVSECACVSVRVSGFALVADSSGASPPSRLDTHPAGA